MILFWMDQKQYKELQRVYRCHISSLEEMLKAVTPAKTRYDQTRQDHLLKEMNDCQEFLKQLEDRARF